jgi:hypothetical protein
VIRPTASYALRALGLSVSVKCRLRESSKLWMFTRVTSSDDAALCIISKAPRSQRLFVTFGCLSAGCLRFFKNQEVPEFYYSLDTQTFTQNSRALQEDFLDFDATLVDNGDDKVCL